MIIKSRAATLAEIGVPDGPKRCPGCRRKTTGNYIAVYDGTPAGKTLIGWQCRSCGYHSLIGGE